METSRPDCGASSRALPYGISFRHESPPAWVDILEAEGWETVHWHEVGEPNAPDAEIMVSARDRGYHVVTNDLDFSTILAATGAEGPSVVQIRAQDLAPATLTPTLVTVLRQYAANLDSGAILTLDARGSKVRALPLG